MRTIILASQSPRRQELLGSMGVSFQTAPSDYDEQLDDSRTPEQVASELGLGKARAVAALYPDALVIGGDTIVTVQFKQLGKPTDEAEARQMLHMLAGKTCQVTSSVALVCLADNTEIAEATTTSVHFKPLDEAAVEAYIQTGDWRDKAGAFGIQSGAAPLISHITGDYDTIVGLPTRLVEALLAAQGIPSKSVTLQAPVPQQTAPMAPSA